MNFSANTDIGQKRSLNQDGFRFGQIDEKTAWGVVCDGMGGMAAGNIASETAVQIISAAFEQNLSPKATPKMIGSLLQTSIESANAAIYDMAQKTEAYRGMGTTVVSFILKNNIAYIANVGDSRAYLCAGDTLTQITTDHSVVQSMVESGQLTADEAKHHPNKNIITRAVGVAPALQTDFYEILVSAGDLLLLCTDGLTNCVDADSLLAAATQSEFSTLADRLIKQANDNGGPDNITVLSLQI